jgi:hypothetical protein
VFSWKTQGKRSSRRAGRSRSLHSPFGSCRAIENPLKYLRWELLRPSPQHHKTTTRVVSREPSVNMKEEFFVFCYEGSEGTLNSGDGSANYVIPDSAPTPPPLGSSLEGKIR